MAAVMRDGVAKHAAERGLNKSPRILGLTASFINGNLRNMESKRRALEALLLSTIICPTVAPKIAADRFKYVTWKEDDSAVKKEKDAIEKHVDNALQKVGHVKEIKKIVSCCWHVFAEIGRKAMFFYIDKVIIQQIIDKASMLKEQDEGSIRCANRMRQPSGGGQRAH